MNSQDFFNHFYKKSSEHSYSKSLLHFFEDFVRARLLENNENDKMYQVLDLGAGSYSLFEDIQHLNSKVLAIDFSKEAIQKAPRSKITYNEMDIGSNSFLGANKYDLVFDSHCLNCIVDETSRSSAFKNIYHALNDNGFFASELMIQPEFNHVLIPYKMIQSTLEIEQVLISHGFKIKYFSISKESGFVSVVNGVEIKCDLLRVIVQK